MTFEERWPIVTLIIVARNAADHIERAVDSLIAQSYPDDLVQYVFVDGCSTDRTKDILVSKARVLLDNDREALVIDNPRKTLAAGWNLAIRVAKGDIVCRIDAHSQLSPEYVHFGVKLLLQNRKDKLAGVGGVISENVGVGANGRAASIFFSSRLGIGNSPFRVVKKTAGASDTAVFALYWRSVFDSVGLFSEELDRNQDIDFHIRLRKQGYYLITNPQMEITYQVRTTILDLALKAYNDGLWAILSGRSYLRHRIPMFFVVYLLSLPFLLFVSPKVSSLPLLVYLLLLAGVMIQRCAFTPLVPIVFLSYHVSYGIGSLVGGVQRIFKRMGDAHE